MPTLFGDLARLRFFRPSTTTTAAAAAAATHNPHDSNSTTTTTTISVDPSPPSSPRVPASPPFEPYVRPRKKKSFRLVRGAIRSRRLRPIAVPVRTDSPVSSASRPSSDTTRTETLDLHDASKSEGRSTSVRTSELKLLSTDLPTVVLEHPTPVLPKTLVPNQDIPPSPVKTPQRPRDSLPKDSAISTTPLHDHASSSSTSPVVARIRDDSVPGENRRQSIVSSANAKIVEALVVSPVQSRGPFSTQPVSSAHPSPFTEDYFSHALPAMANLTRKIWVRRPGASATLVQIREDDLVDDVRDMILRKYANSLGKTFDAPDMTLRISQRSDHGGPRAERVLGPEEEMCRTIDTYYPGGQSVEDALIIDVPQKRTPRPSPKVYHHPSYHQTMDDYRPHENGTDYFPPMPHIPVVASPGVRTSSTHDSPHGHHHNSVPTDQYANPKSISVLTTGQIAPLPSPGGTRRYHRPKVGRIHTTSPTVNTHPNAGTIAVNPSNLYLGHRSANSGRPRGESAASDKLYVPNGAPAAPPLPTPPIPENQNIGAAGSNPPTPGMISMRTPRPRKMRRTTPDKGRRHQHSGSTSSHIALQNTLLDGSVPPINVLIVEDNIINLRILEGLMKRLKVRWQTALNGQIAVDKWKTGGFHLVLMDIQMPVMNGLQATKEIRRLERVNGIGVFSSSDSAATSPVSEGGEGEDEKGKKKAKEDDKLDMSEGLFKSPIIIVALTASSLQSDRHEALAAGCNDFLTKPVNFVWLERKVKEWGCMQALIDFDGWRKWKDYAAKAEEGKTEEQRKADKEKEEKQRIKMEKFQKLQEKQAAKRKEEEKKKKEAASAAAAEQEDNTTTESETNASGNGTGNNGIGSA